MGSDAVKVALVKRKNMEATKKKRPAWYNAVQELTETQARQDAQYAKELSAIRQTISTNHRRVLVLVSVGIVVIACVVGVIVGFAYGVLSWP